MYIANKELTQEWQAIEEVNTGDSFLIQNITGHNIYFCVLSSVPEATVRGGVLESHQQLSFKKVTGSMYMKRGSEGEDHVCLYIEKVEA